MDKKRTDVVVNKVSFCSLLAEKLLLEKVKVYIPNISLDDLIYCDGQGVLSYKQQYQDIFNSYYDLCYNILEEVGYEK